jgi:hypothetical protein
MFGDRCPTCGHVSVTFDIEAPASPASVALETAAR